jgi:hypothetical protein
MKNRFANSNEAGFYDYLTSQRKYRESTVWDYIWRIRKIESMDTLVHKKLTHYIDDYETGVHQEINATCHNAYTCALKRLREYQDYLGITAA